MNDEFPKLLEHKFSYNIAGGLQMKFSYSPTLAHSERFADLTGDRNPIHRELFEGETVAPAFLQNIVAILASRKAISEHGLNPVDFPRSHNRVSLDNFVVTGLDYEFLVTLKDTPLKVEVAINDPKGNKVFGMDRTFEGVRPPEDYAKLIYSRLLNTNGHVLSEFGDVVSATSPESNLYGIASSSAVILDAYDAKALPEMDENVAPIYTRQEIYADVSKSVRNEIDVWLTVPELPVGQLKRGDKIETMISSLHRGNLISRIASEIVFQNEKLPKLAVRKALKSRKEHA